MALTRRQKQVYDFLAQFVEKNGYSPSFEEIGEGLGLSSLATVHKHVSNLEQKGLLKRDYNRSRSIDLLKPRGRMKQAFAGAATAIVGNGHMIRKAYFPRWIPVVASTLSATMTLAVNMSLMLAIGIPLGWFHVGLHTLLLPLLFVELYLLVVGIGLLLSALFVFYRDLGHVWEISLQLLFYGSAIVFPLTRLSPRYRMLLAFNPMAQIIEDMRRAVVTTAIPWSGQILGRWTFVPILAVVAVLGVGVRVFRRLTPKFGEAI